MRTLLEGLKAGDLADLVIPVVTIDEYESKIDDNAIVVGFYVSYKDPANDLNNFLQKCPEEIYDTDISLAPDTEGNYLVFIELPRDDNFPEKIVGICDAIAGLTGIDEWSFRYRNGDDILPLTVENIEDVVEL